MDERIPFAPVIQEVTAFWRSLAVGAAVHHSVFTHVENGADSIEKLANAANISERGARTLLDGLTGIGLLTVRNGSYRNSPSASEYLVKGKPHYVGGFVKIFFDTIARAPEFPDAVKSGQAVLRWEEKHPAWDDLVVGIAPLSIPTAELVVQHLRLAARGPVSILDIGGGAGIFSAVFLKANADARATQIDYPEVNRVARQLTSDWGVADRFDTVDGDMFELDLGFQKFDVAVFSHMAHAWGPDRNLQMLKKIQRALKPGGTVVIQEYVTAEEGVGHPFALLFSVNLLMASPEGAVWRDKEYAAWLTQSGFTNVRLEPTGTPASLIYAEAANSAAA